MRSTGQGKQKSEWVRSTHLLEQAVWWEGCTCKGGEGQEPKVEERTAGVLNLPRTRLKLVEVVIVACTGDVEQRQPWREKEKKGGPRTFRKEWT